MSNLHTLAASLLGLSGDKDAHAESTGAAVAAAVVTLVQHATLGPIESAAAALSGLTGRSKAKTATLAAFVAACEASGVLSVSGANADGTRTKDGNKVAPIMVRDIRAKGQKRGTAEAAKDAGRAAEAAFVGTWATSYYAPTVKADKATPDAGADEAAGADGMQAPRADEAGEAMADMSAMLATLATLTDAQLSALAGTDPDAARRIAACFGVALSASAGAAAAVTSKAKRRAAKAEPVAAVADAAPVGSDAAPVAPAADAPAVVGPMLEAA